MCVTSSHKESVSGSVCMWMVPLEQVPVIVLDFLFHLFKYKPCWGGWACGTRVKSPLLRFTAHTGMFGSNSGYSASNPVAANVHPGRQVMTQVLGSLTLMWETFSLAQLWLYLEGRTSECKIFLRLPLGDRPLHVTETLVEFL